MLQVFQGQHTAFVALLDSKALRHLGIDYRILSGDRPEAVAPIAAALGINEWRGGAKPAGPGPDHDSIRPLLGHENLPERAAGWSRARR